MSDSAPIPSPLLKAIGRFARWSLGLTLSAWVLFAVIWGAIHWLIVPRIGDLRPRLEATASRVLGVPVTIGAITAQSSGMLPSFELTDVRLFDSMGREALRLPRVVAALSPRSALGLKFEQLYIDRPALDIRRHASGKITVAGLDFSSGASDGGSAADWLFSQPEFVIRNGTLHWTDELRGAPPLSLSQVDLVMRNSFLNHALRLDATPEAGLGGRFNAMGVFKQPLLSLRNGQWRDWSGQIYAAFERVDVARLRRHADLGFEVAQGTGAVRAWIDVNRAEITGATADLALSNVNTTLGSRLPPLEMHSVAGRLEGRFLPGGFEIQSKGLQFQTRGGLAWPGGNFRLMQVGGESLAPAAGASGMQGTGANPVPARGELVADKLDLAVLSQLADRLPLGAQTHAALALWRARGLVENIRASWQGPLGAPQKYEARGRVAQLAIAPRDSGPPAASAGVGAAGAAAGTAGARAPGIRGASVDFDLNQLGGRASLALNNGAVELPGFFDDPVIPLAQLSADVLWQIDGDRVSVQGSSVKFSNADAQGEAQFKWRSAVANPAKGRSRFPGVLDLQGSMSRMQGTRVYRYLPKAMLPQVRDYVRDAVVKGTGSNVKFTVKGDLHDLPFTDPSHGDFRISATMADVTLAYVPRSIAAPDTLPWPELTQLSGEFLIDRVSLQVKGVKGRMAAPADASGNPGSPSLQITSAEGEIPDLLQGATVLLNAEARGPLATMLAVVNGSPVSQMTSEALALATGTGNADLRLKLNLPLGALDKSTVQGSVTLAGNDVQITPATPRLERARGVVGFSESGFSISNGQARMYGGDITLAGGSTGAAGLAGSGAPALPAASAAASASAAKPQAARDPPDIVIRAQGSVTAEALRQASELGFVSRLAQHATGSAAYTAVLGFRRGVSELAVSSNLVGAALNLPAPLGKAADMSLPFRFETAPVRDAAPARQLDQLQIDLGRVAQIAYVRDVSGLEPRVVRGSIAVGLANDETAPLPVEGVVANINLANADMDAWGAVLAQAAGARLTPQDATVRTAPAASNASAAPGAGASASAALTYLPTSLAVRSRELTFGGRKLTNVVVGGSRDGLTWRANLDARELNGYVEYRQPSGAGAGRVYARLARLTLAQASAKEVETLLDEQPVTIPALDIVVDDLELRGKRLGRVEIEAVNRGAAAVAREGGVREWRLNKLNVIAPEAVFAATGNWASASGQNSAAAGAPGNSPARAGPERRRTVMNFRLDVQDAGELLARYGMKDVVRGGKGKLEGQVAWVGSPLSVDYPTMGGAFTVNVDSGQFLKADPGIAKLLGVLSLQSLPRRLALDFRDVFTEGFSFDFVRGDVRIEQGIASTNNLQMKGVNAAVLMDGRANIAKETQDLRVIVVPEINAGTASLIATVINPAVGLGTFLAQMLLRRPLMEASTQEFLIDGSWVDPQITKVARTLGAPTGADVTADPKPAARSNARSDSNSDSKSDGKMESVQ